MHRIRYEKSASKVSLFSGGPRVPGPPAARVCREEKLLPAPPPPRPRAPRAARHPGRRAGGAQSARQKSLSRPAIGQQRAGQGGAGRWPRARRAPARGPRGSCVRGAVPPAPRPGSADITGVKAAGLNCTNAAQSYRHLQQSLNCLASFSLLSLSPFVPAFHVAGARVRVRASNLSIIDSMPASINP